MAINLDIIIPLLIFYLIGFYLIFFIIKTKLFSSQVNYNGNFPDLNKGLMVLLVIFSLLIPSAYFGLISLNIYYQSLSNLIINGILIIAIGAIIFLILIESIIYLMNHGRNIDRKGIKTKLLVFCFIIFISISLFSSLLVTNAQSTNYQIDSATTYSTNSQFSKVAYIEYYWHNGESSHIFLVVKTRL